LVGISWGLLREAFVRKFFVQCIESAPKLRDGAPIKQRLRHLFSSNAMFIQCVLYELSFFLASKPLLEQDRIYTRCAGTLPKSERGKIKDVMKAVQAVDTMEKIWVMLGMDDGLCEQELLLSHMDNYLTFLNANLQKWRDGKDTSKNQNNNNEMKVPALDQASVANLGILQYNSDLVLQAQRLLAEEQQKHLGYPVIPTNGNLDDFTCNYEGCGKKFKCRDHLFRHLKRMIPPERMINGYHRQHAKLNIQDPNVTSCPGCKKQTKTVGEMQDHWAEMGVRPFFSARKAHKIKEGKEIEKEQAQAHIDQYEADSCVICLDARREVVNIPCGHLVCCKVCGFVQKTCPICRADIKDVILVYYA